MSNGFLVNGAGFGVGGAGVGDGSFENILRISTVTAGGTFSVYDPVRLSSGQYIQANATTQDDSAARGLAIEAGTASADFLMVTNGLVAGAIAGADPGQRYYLSSSGGLTTSAPSGSGEWVVEVGRAVSATDLWVDIQSPTQNAIVPDPLVALNDTFDGVDDIETRGWSIYQSGVLGTSEIASGRYRHTATDGGTPGSFWFNAADGYLIYRGNQIGNLISGNCDMRIRQVVQNSAFSGLPTASQFRITGIAAHDPDRVSEFNYVHIGAGYASGSYGIETKNTISNASTFPTVTLAPTAPWTIDVRLVRVGDDITSYYRHAPSVSLDSDVDWVQHIVNTRADLPTDLQWGLIGYSNADIHDISSDVEDVQFSTP